MATHDRRPAITSIGVAAQSPVVHAQPMAHSPSHYSAAIGRGVRGLTRGANLPVVGSFNQALVLDVLRRDEAGLSRVELSELTGLSSQTISNIVRRLLDDAWIEQGEPVAVGPGKPRTPLRIASRRSCAIGVHIDPMVTTTVLTDVSGTVIDRSLGPGAGANVPEIEVQIVVDQALALIDAHGLRREQVLGIGVAVPGPLDRDGEVLAHPPMLKQWQRVPIAQMLRDATGMPVLLEKDVNTLVAAERWATRHDPPTTWASFYLGAGVGVGMCIDGGIVQGSSGNAGEIGALPMPSGVELGPAVDPAALIENARRAGALPSAGSDGIRADLGRVVELAASDPAARELVGQVASALAEGALAVANLLDLHHIYVGGPYGDILGPAVVPAIVRILDERFLMRELHRVQVGLSPAGSDGTGVGAACLLLDSAFAPGGSL